MRWIAARLTAAVIALALTVGSAALSASADNTKSKKKDKAQDTVSAVDDTSDDDDSADSEEVSDDAPEDDPDRDMENFHRNGAWGYTVLADDTAAVCKYYGDSKHPGVPAEIDGHTVTALSGGWLINGTGELLLYGNIHGITYNDDGTVKTSTVYSPFSGNKSIVEVTLPDTVRYIGAISFKGCKKLKKINFGENVALIGNNCFEDCTSLETLQLPETVTYIDQNAFKGCTALNQASLPAAHFEGAVFEDCTALETVFLSNGMDNISQQMFSGCTSLKEITVPEGVGSIGDSAFLGCSSLKSATLPNSSTAIYNNAFMGCTSLEQVTLGSKTDTIGSRAFADCPIKKLTAPETLVRIGEAAFGMTSEGKPIEGFVLSCPEYSAAQSYAENNSLALETTAAAEPPAESVSGEPTEEQAPAPVSLMDDDAVFKLTLAALAVTALAVVIAIILIVKNRTADAYEDGEYYDDDD